jgi:hypothetical protein
LAFFRHRGLVVRHVVQRRQHKQVGSLEVDVPFLERSDVFNDGQRVPLKRKKEEKKKETTEFKRGDNERWHYFAFMIKLLQSKNVFLSEARFVNNATNLFSLYCEQSRFDFFFMACSPQKGRGRISAQ